MKGVVLKKKGVLGVFNENFASELIERSTFEVPTAEEVKQFNAENNTKFKAIKTPEIGVESTNTDKDVKLSADGENVKSSAVNESESKLNELSDEQILAILREKKVPGVNPNWKRATLEKKLMELSK